MSSVPSEVLQDVLQPLDRWTLDDAQFTDRRFLHLITNHMSDVCLRKIFHARFRAPSENENTDSSWFAVHVEGRPERKICHKDTARLFADFVQALRLVFTPELAALVLQAPIVTTTLDLTGNSCADLAPTNFHEVLLHFSPSALNVDACHLRACQVTGAFLRALSKNGVRRTLFEDIVPVDGGSFCVTDDDVVEFCVQQDVPVGKEGDASSQPALILDNGSFTKDLFRRLIEASSVSMRTQQLRIEVSPVLVEDEDLRDFAQHLSYRYRGTLLEMRIYDLTRVQQGVNAAMHLQIVLHSEDNRLEMTRATRSL